MRENNKAEQRKARNTKIEDRPHQSTNRHVVLRPTHGEPSSRDYLAQSHCAWDQEKYTADCNEVPGHDDKDTDHCLDSTDDQRLRILTRRKMKDLKKKKSGRLRRSFSIVHFRLEKSLHLRRLMAQLRRRQTKTVPSQPLQNPSSMRLPMKRSPLNLLAPLRHFNRIVIRESTTKTEKMVVS
ncbi:hypothetical protein QR680_008858 [Steinernema hermaphroditum]|uniref:Uncharacterized protein n=1 Tax=Steinernema hermaphroditum TaxID=289476 RepID=A0AA39IJN7_9BILA|nr:hypothetical protein QR680_008858 [Steinernema hermaphroditum]